MSAVVLVLACPRISLAVRIETAPSANIALQEHDHFKGTRRGFAGARPTASGLLAGYFDLQREVHDSRVTRVSPYTARPFVHQFRVSSIDGLDDQFGALLCEAYQVGAGAHVSS